MDRIAEEEEETSKDGGFVLPVALWSLALVALIVVGFLAASRTSIRLAGNAATNAEAVALAEAGVSIAILDLAAARRMQGLGRRLPPDGKPTTCRAPNGGSLVIRIEDEGGKVDLNLASKELLARLLLGLGASRSEADMIADRIADYRDADTERQLNGAEHDDYRSAGRSDGPADAAFVATDQLASVLGMPDNMFALLQPLVTVYSTSGGFDPTVAPPALLEALAGTGRFAAAGLGHASLALASDLTTRSPGSTFMIHSVAVASDGASAERRAVVEFPLSRQSAYRIRRWWTYAGSTAPAGKPAQSPPPVRHLGEC